MKLLILFILITSVLLFSNCQKSSSSDNIVTHINCDGLITDTLGTGDNGKIYMPTAFTPNGDGRDDIIRPIPVNLSSIVFTIYDENNNVVFTTNQLSQGWFPVTGSNVHIKYYYKIQAFTVSNHRIGKCGELYRLTCLPSNLPLSSIYFEDQLTINGFSVPTGETLSTCP
jgi:hypothetical protein